MHILSHKSKLSTRKMKSSSVKGKSQKQDGSSLDEGDGYTGSDGTETRSSTAAASIPSFFISLHFAWVVDDAKCIVVTSVCVFVCVSVCLSVRGCIPTLLHGPECNLEDGRGCPLVVHCWAALQSVHGLRCYGNITRMRNVSEYMLVLALCLVLLVILTALLFIFVHSRLEKITCYRQQFYRLVLGNHGLASHSTNKYRLQHCLQLIMPVKQAIINCRT